MAACRTSDFKPTKAFRLHFVYFPVVARLVHKTIFEKWICSKYYETSNIDNTRHLLYFRWFVASNYPATSTMATFAIESDGRVGLRSFFQEESAYKNEIRTPKTKNNMLMNSNSVHDRVLEDLKTLLTTLKNCKDLPCMQKFRSRLLRWSNTLVTQQHTLELKSKTA